MILFLVLAQQEVSPLSIGIPVATWAAGLLLLATLGGRVLRGQGNRITDLEDQVSTQQHTLRWQRYKLDWLAPKAVRGGVTIPPAFYREPSSDEPFPDLDRQS